MTRRPLPTRARRVDLIAQAEARLYPGLPWRRYTREQRVETVNIAKAQLVLAGQWPVGPGEREEVRMLRGAA